MPLNTNSIHCVYKGLLGYQIVIPPWYIKHLLLLNVIIIITILKMALNTNSIKNVYIKAFFFFFPNCNGSLTKHCSCMKKPLLHI